MITLHSITLCPYLLKVIMHYAHYAKYTCRLKKILPVFCSRLYPCPEHNIILMFIYIAVTSHVKMRMVREDGY